MPNSTKTLSENTELFSSLPPAVAVLINDVIHAVYLTLCWRQASKSFLAEILSRLAETESFELSHYDFCAALWPHLDLKRRKEKISRWVARLRVDMEMSRFNAVFIPKQKVERTEEGGFRGHPTTYKIGHFWKLFRYVQDKARDIDLLSFPVNKRRAHVRVFVVEWLNEAGAVRIERETKEEKSPPKPSPPCRCNCAPCATCAAKNATASEAAGAMKAEMRIDKASVAVRIANAFDQILYECGQDWMNLGFSLGSFEVQLDKEREQTSNRLREAMVRANKSNLRLVGGQPK